jgi:hypothetical protein
LYRGNPGMLCEVRCPCGWSVPMRSTSFDQMVLDERGSSERFTVTLG